MYNLTNFSSANDFLGVAVATNSITSNWFGVFFLITLGVINFGILKDYQSGGAAFRAVMFLMCLVGYLASFAGFITGFALYTIWVVASVSIFATFLFSK